MKFIPALQLSLIILKLIGFVTWSWFYVLLPFIIVIGIPLAVFLVLFAYEWIKND